MVRGRMRRPLVVTHEQRQKVMCEVMCCGLLSVWPGTATSSQAETSPVCLALVFILLLSYSLSASKSR